MKKPITLKSILTALVLTGLVLPVDSLLAATAKTAPAKASKKKDPFANVLEKSGVLEDSSSGGDFFTDNFGFRRELMSEFGLDSRSEAASRQSIGFEIQKKFSSETKTLAGLDFQARLVRRDGFVHAPNDMEGMSRAGWFFEVHNAYLDFYNLLGEVGRLNFRVGRFYVPFGLNLQTDTHGTILQLSNEMNFGFERDWFAGFWGSLGKDLNYDLYYLLGSGYDLQFAGQGGLGALRLSLGNRALSESSLEGGISFLRGGRLVSGAAVDTLRVGLDGRGRISGGQGTWTWTSELSAGADSPDGVLTQLHQLDYLPSSRLWGLAAQVRGISRSFQPGGGMESSLLAEATWYFRNDVGGSNLQWIKLNVEWRLDGPSGLGPTATLQYYQYW